MKKDDNNEKSLEEKKAELEAQLKKIQSQINDDKVEEEDNSEDLWLKVVRKVIIGLWGVIILIIVGIIALYTYSKYLDKVIEDEKPKNEYSTEQNVVDLNTIVTTPGLEDNNTIVDENGTVNE